ncbi:hypothetical protein O6H91_02G115100 [Diphasiastrum complanatum]|uniref:Uncharacterized protein n=1 Tax=Diphasiastrum complanatum TaxID=34168 RepID=A0ACC2EJT2_DIPCM|nr:hypothetical protein O6H91_02G115100 [Diphasiastrum complanatum]
MSVLACVSWEEKKHRCSLRQLVSHSFASAMQCYCSNPKFVPVMSWLTWIACLLMSSSLVEASLAATEVNALRDIASVLQLNSSDVGSAWNTTGADPCTWKGIYCDAMGEHVINITLELENLRGEVPASLANLTSLVKIDLANNFLSGRIPSELGTLSSLQYLSFGGNNLTGEIPSEFGTLKSLQTLYLDNNLLEGGIPTSFANLTSLQVIHLSSNSLTGVIPSELGSLTLLTDLHLDNNGFSGQIPITFSNLTNLLILALDSNNLSGGLSVLEKMPALEKLFLARNDFSGQIPQFGVSSSNLVALFLCFNKLSGTIPSSLGNVLSLTVLCLSHNNLSGTIPSTFGANLFNLAILDVSHNSLSGSLSFTQTTSWSQRYLASDFSFNYFGSDASSDLPSNLRIGNNTLFNSCSVSLSSSNNYTAPSCSQSQPGNNSQFAINVGGDSAVQNAKNGVTFVKDLFFQASVGLQIDPTNTWALQVSGGGAGSVVSMKTSIANVSADEVEGVYQSMRWSPIYLAYYGINMQNGRYNVNLYFAEIVFKLPGYRVFDVIVQGELVLSNLDVVKEVGYATAFRKVVQANVTDGLLKIEFLYVGPNRWLDPGLVQPNLVNGTGPMVSGISVKQLQLYSALGYPTSHTKTWTIIGATVAAVAALAILSLVVLRTWKRQEKESESSEKQASSESALLSADLNRPAFYSYKELQDATDNFSDANIIGKGGFGTVYRGVLKDKSVVAIKQLTQKCHSSRASFRSEISILSSVQHRNLLSLRGCCLDTEFPLLVCEYLPNGSLSDVLYKAGSVLGWEIRRHIAIGTASGLAYLHHELKHRIIHCDVKPANILLDANYNPLIADFGLSRLLYDDTVSHISTSNIKGTMGYLAPEYAGLWHLSEKIDVFSFGVVLLEILSGRHALDLSLPSGQIELWNWANAIGEEPKDLLKLVDPKLVGQMVEEEALNMAKVARLCTQESSSLRPTMRMVWQMLNECTY